VPRPVEAVNVSPAYLFRKVADDNGAPTLLFDEIDTVFGPKAKDNEEIRGHRKGAVAGRCVVEEVIRVTGPQPNGNGHDDISYNERVELMMKHTGPEAEAAAWN
jgi:hypothetical protein